MTVLIVGVLGLSGLLGWMKASDTDMTEREDVDSWNNLIGSTVSNPNYAAIARQIRISGAVPASNKGALVGGNSVTSQESNDGTKAPGFPQIVATAIIDDVPQVTLYYEDKSVLSVRAGDVLESGWEVVKVDLRNVVAAFDGEQHNFPVLSYDPFERGDELVEGKNEIK